MARRPVVALFAGAALLLGLSATAAWWWQRGEPPPPPLPAAVPEPEPVAVPPVHADPGPPPPPPPRDAPGVLLDYPPPDGKQPALNGVQQRVEISWAANIPYARIVGKVTDHNGHEWYEHADGTTTTTYYIWRKDLGRYDAQSVVRHPAAAVPIPAEEMPGRK